jgi:arsenate reductase-like glutaredoxin family protein
MGLSLEKLTKAKAIELALKEPNLLRRPIVVAGKKVVFGYRAGDGI